MKILFLNSRLFCRNCFLVLCFVFLKKELNAQNQVSDSLLPYKITSLENYYKKVIGSFMRPFYGTAYTFINQRAYGFPFWNTDSMRLGSIVYDHVLYNEIPLQYDIVNQLLVTTEPQKGFLIVLLSDKINSFSIDGHHFFTIKANDSNNIIKTGYYERLINNNYSLWAKRDKEFKLPLRPDELTGNYNTVNTYYIALNEKFYTVQNKKEILSVLNDKKEAIRSFIKLNKLSFNAKIEEALIKVMAYYNTLK
jgi:hypothetical protein